MKIFSANKIAFEKLQLIFSLLIIVSSVEISGQNSITKFNDFSIINIRSENTFLQKSQENYLKLNLCYLNATFNYIPLKKIYLINNNYSKTINSTSSPFNTIVFSPYNYRKAINNTLSPIRNLNSILNYQTTQICIIDKAAKKDILRRKIFLGKVEYSSENPLTLLYNYLTTPRNLSPDWYKEGIGIYNNDIINNDTSNTFSLYTEMVFRTKLKEDSYFLRPVGFPQEEKPDEINEGNKSAIYGSRFNYYLSLKRGCMKLKDLYSRSDNSKMTYVQQYKKIYSNKLIDEWEDWLGFELIHQNENLKLISKNPITPDIKISKPISKALTKIVYIKENNSIIGICTFANKKSKLCSINLSDGEIKKYCTIFSPHNYLIVKNGKENSILIYKDFCKKFGLKKVNLETRKKSKLIKQTEFDDIVVNSQDETIILLKNNDGKASLALYSPINNKFNIYYPFSNNLILKNLNISNDGKMILGLIDVLNNKKQLIVFNTSDIKNKGISYITLKEYEQDLFSGFIFSDDNKYIYYSSYLSGVSNIERINIETKETDILTNSETGYFNPIPINNDSMIALNYSSKGYTPVMIKIKPINDINGINNLQTLSIKKIIDSVENNTKTNFNDSLNLEKNKYKYCKETYLSGGYPIIEGYKNSFCIGYKINFSDITSQQTLSVSASYSPAFKYKEMPGKEKLHLCINYKISNLKFKLAYNYSDFYDLLGDNKFSRSGYLSELEYKYNFGSNNEISQGLNFNLGAYFDIQCLPEYQNALINLKNLFEGNISYFRKKIFISNITNEEEYGYRLKGGIDLSYANKDLVPKIVFNINYGFLMPMPNSSMWFHLSTGKGFNKESQILSKFYFGSFVYNGIDTKERDEFREFTEFPGLYIDDISTQSFGKLKVDFKLPTIRFRELGFVGFYATNFRVNVFGGTLASNFEYPDNIKMYYDCGLKLNFGLVLFSWLKSTLSLAYARAFSSQRPGDEFLFSIIL